MSFSMADYLQDYRKEDITKEKEIMKTKWRKTLDIIKEAFADKFVNSAEAQRIIKNEFAGNDCPKNLDKKFLEENLDYVIDKVKNLSEGDIRIIINNGSKEKAGKAVEVEEFDEAKGKKGKKKGKKEKDADEDEPVMDGEDEVIVDSPTDADEIAVSSAEAPEQLEVTIAYDAEEKKLTVTEGEEVIEELEIEDADALQQVVDFLKDFYSKHDYIVNEEGLEDIEAAHEAGETSEEEKAEHESGAEAPDEGSDIPMEPEIEEQYESRKWGFLDLLEEGFEQITEEEIAKPKGCDLVGKAVEVSGKGWYTVQECDDSNMLKVLDKDGQSSVIDLKDITDWEKAVLPKKESVELEGEVVAEAAKKVSMPWLKKKSPSTGKSTALKSVIDKKKDVKSQGLTKSPAKPKQKLEKIKIPTVTKKGESSANLTGKSGTKSPSKVPSVKTVPAQKKEAPTGSFSKSPMKVSGKVPSVTVPKSTGKPAPSGTYTKKPAKPAEKHEKVKAPKF